MGRFNVIVGSIICGALAVMLTSAALEFWAVATSPRSIPPGPFRIALFLAAMAVIVVMGFLLLGKMVLSKILDKRKEEK